MIDPDDRRPFLIFGPTASGKSALALALASRLHGSVINADALQVYADWRVLTARPTEADMAAAPHGLYGHVDAATPDYSVGRWLSEARDALAAATSRDRVPIIVGGSGLYFTALTEGLADIPPTPADIRAALSARLSDAGPAALAADISARDPETAADLDLANPRRVLRALEVLETTGRGLAAWRRETPPPLLPLCATRPLALSPDPERLDRRIARRFDAMMAAGALDEVRRVVARALPHDLPALRAHGHGALARHLAGEIDAAEAARLTTTETRQYAKRQRTFARGRMREWPRLPGVGDAVDIDGLASLWPPAR